MQNQNKTQAYAASASKLVFSNAKEQDWQGKITGQLPGWAKGTLYLNGPAAFINGDINREHWIDGDGLVRRFSFTVDEASFCSRYVQTQKLVDEKTQSKALYRSFGTSFSGDRLRDGLSLYSPTNVSVHPVAGQLLAFGEQSLPWLMDAKKLTTSKEYTFDEKLTGISALSAHPKIDSHYNHMCNFGVTYLGLRTSFEYYEWDNKLAMKVYAKTDLPDSYLIHDCVVSEHFAGFYLSPYFLNILSFTRRNQSLVESMRWKGNKQSKMLILSRDSGKLLSITGIDTNGFCLHTLNSYEDDNKLIIDVLEADEAYYDQYFANPGLFNDIGPTRIRRSIFDSTDGHLCHTDHIDLNMHFDFPCIVKDQVGRDYQYFWMLGMPSKPTMPKFYDRLVRFDWQQRKITDTYHSSPGCFLAAEPQFISHPEQADNGLLVCQELNVTSQHSSYLFFDAFALNKGPIARADLPFFDPPAFHTSLSSDT
jgi:carotenoid cleavage dioxygenase-like enzyme